MPRKARPPLAPAYGVPAGCCVPCWDEEDRRTAGEEYALPANRPLPWWPWPVDGHYRMTLCDQHWVIGAEIGLGLGRAEPGWPLAPRFRQTPAGQCAECWYAYRPGARGSVVQVGGRRVRLCGRCQGRLRRAGWVVAEVAGRP